MGWRLFLILLTQHVVPKTGDGLRTKHLLCTSLVLRGVTGFKTDIFADFRRLHVVFKSGYELLHLRPSLYLSICLPACTIAASY